MTGFLDDAPAAAQDAAALARLLQELTTASLVGHIDFEARNAIAGDMGDLLERLDAYRLRVRG